MKKHHYLLFLAPLLIAVGLYFNFQKEASRTADFKLPSSSNRVLFKVFSKFGKAFRGPSERGPASAQKVDDKPTPMDEKDPEIRYKVDPSKKTICSITINSENEIKQFKKSLGEDNFNFIELVNRNDYSWLNTACERGITCDSLVVSGHFGGSFFNEDHSISLPLSTLENSSCKSYCSGIFHKPKEVYLFGCNTLAGKKKDHRTPEEYVRVLVEHGMSINMAQQMSSIRYSSIGSAFGDRMQRTFSGVPRIYGFPSVAPLGSYAEGAVEKYLRPYTPAKFEQDKLVSSSTKEDRRLRKIMRTLAQFEQVTGTEQSFNPVCFLRNEDHYISQKIQWVHATLKSDKKYHYVSYIYNFLKSLKSHPSFTPVNAYYLRIQKDKALKKEFLDFAKSSVNELIYVRQQILNLARELNWISLKDYDNSITEVFLSVKDFNNETKDLICSLDDRPYLSKSSIPERLWKNKHFVESLRCFKIVDPNLISYMGDEIERIFSKPGIDEMMMLSFKGEAEADEEKMKKLMTKHEEAFVDMFFTSIAQGPDQDKDSMKALFPLKAWVNSEVQTLAIIGQMIGSLADAASTELESFDFKAALTKLEGSKSNEFQRVIDLGIFKGMLGAAIYADKKNLIPEDTAKVLVDVLLKEVAGGMHLSEDEFYKNEALVELLSDMGSIFSYLDEIKLPKGTKALDFYKKNAEVLDENMSEFADNLPHFIDSGPEFFSFAKSQVKKIKAKDKFESEGWRAIDFLVKSAPSTLDLYTYVDEVLEGTSSYVAERLVYGSMAKFPSQSYAKLDKADQLKYRKFIEKWIEKVPLKNGILGSYLVTLNLEDEAAISDLLIKVSGEKSFQSRILGSDVFGHEKIRQYFYENVIANKKVSFKEKVRFVRILPSISEEPSAIRKKSEDLLFSDKRFSNFLISEIREMRKLKYDAKLPLVKEITLVAARRDYGTEIKFEEIDRSELEDYFSSGFEDYMSYSTNSLANFKYDNREFFTESLVKFKELENLPNDSELPNWARSAFSILKGFGAANSDDIKIVESVLLKSKSEEARFKTMEILNFWSAPVNKAFEPMLIDILSNRSVAHAHVKVGEFNKFAARVSTASPQVERLLVDYLLDVTNERRGSVASALVKVGGPKEAKSYTALKKLQETTFDSYLSRDLKGL